MQKIFKVSLLAVLSSLAVNSFASMAEVKVLEPQLNYQQLLTQRQVVDELLEQAVKIQTHRLVFQMQVLPRNFLPIWSVLRIFY